MTSVTLTSPSIVQPGTMPTPEITRNPYNFTDISGLNLRGDKMCGCDDFGCLVNLFFYSNGNFNPLGFIVTLHQRNPFGNWEPVINPNTNQPIQADVLPSQCIPCPEGGDCICQNMVAGVTRRPISLPPIMDCVGGDMTIFKFSFSIPKCTGETYAIEPTITILGPAGHLLLLNYTSISDSTSTAGSVLIEVEITGAEARAVCRWLDNYPVQNPGVNTACPYGTEILTSIPGKPSQESKCECPSGSPTEPSDSECPRNQNIVNQITGHVGGTPATCTCYECNDKCMVFEWDAPTGWTKGISSCGPGYIVEFNHDYYPDPNDTWKCTISRCVPCANTYDKTGECIQYFSDGVPVSTYGILECTPSETVAGCWDCWIAAEGSGYCPGYGP